MSARVDLFRLHAEEYATGRAPRVVTVGPARFLALAGRGEPEGARFQDQVQALQRVAGALRAHIRRARGKDFKLPLLEVLWWDDPPLDPGGGCPADRHWKLLLRMPSFVRRVDIAGAAGDLGDPGALAHESAVRLEDLKEGRCIQALHVGPWQSQAQTLARMQRAAAEHGLAFHGRQHDVYLSDPQRVPGERRKTLLRRAVRAR
ncbi:MAG TPA: GyrI-like domain-containing protein [Anaeromyxobacteraceae bacterium]|nr:GyrI-like domain-containing protein [Anaeromyxobacteraceae bacterium]